MSSVDLSLIQTYENYENKIKLDPFENFPIELLELIFSKLPKNTLLECSCVNKKFRNLSRKPLARIEYSDEKLADAFARGAWRLSVPRLLKGIMVDEIPINPPSTHWFKLLWDAKYSLYLKEVVIWEEKPYINPNQEWKETRGEMQLPYTLLIAASEWGNVALVKALLQDKRVVPTSYENRALLFALVANHQEIVQLLLENSSVSSTIEFPYCKEKLLHFLIKKSSVPSAWLKTIPSYQLKTAIRTGNIVAVQLLLKDPRVNPALDNDQVLYRAIVAEQTEICELLLNDRRVNPDPFVLLEAVRRQKIDIIKLLLKDDRVEFRENYNLARRAAEMKKNHEIVQLLENAI